MTRQHLSGAISKNYQIAQELEYFLGDPCDQKSGFSYRKCMEFDENDRFPESFISILIDWGLLEYLIPKKENGRLQTFEELAATLRILARRDMSVAVAFGQTMLGALPVWIAGSDKQKHKLISSIRNGGLGCLALTEESHGSDLFSGECSATEIAEGFKISGEKWLINNATVGEWFTALLRTHNRGGPRGLSVLNINKHEIDSNSYKNLSKIQTHGLRGADISGFRFNNSIVPENSLIGPIGTGMDTTLKTLQVSRTFCSGFSLGAADTALRVSLDFALNRKLYGRSIFSIPSVKESLSGCFLDILIAECVSISGCRAIHVMPNQISLCSAVVKYFVPTSIEKLIDKAALILGARYYLRNHYVFGIFQKTLRDNAVISLFDGSTAINLYTIANQMPLLSKNRPAQSGLNNLDERLRSLENLFNLKSEMPPFTPSLLKLTNSGQDDFINSLPLALSRVEKMNGKSDIQPQIIDKLVKLIKLFAEEIENLDTNVASRSDNKMYPPNSTERFNLAKRHCVIHAAASCIHMWLANRDALDEFFAGGDWLVLSLNRLIHSIRGNETGISESGMDVIADELVKRLLDNKLFSTLPITLPGTYQTLRKVATI